VPADYRAVLDAAHAAIAAFDTAPAGIERDEAAAGLRAATAELLDVLDGGEG